MPYRQIEQLDDRTQERIFWFLSLERFFALVIVCLPAYILTDGLPFGIRISGLAVAALLGGAATMEVGGLPLYIRALWDVRGMIRRMRGGRITPEQISGRRQILRGRAEELSSPIQEVADTQVYQPATHGTRARAARSRRTDRDLVLAEPLQASNPTDTESLLVTN